jgi:hypothetical protein
MQILKILLGVLALLLAWIYIYRTRLIYTLNAWMRENVFSDQVVLFSNRRLATLLLILGAVALFSGIKDLEEFRPIRPQVAASMLDQARGEFKNRAYLAVISRCRQLVRSNPKNTEAWELLAGSWWAIGRKNMAFQAMQGLMSNNPDYPINSSPLKNILQESKGNHS